MKERWQPIRGFKGSYEVSDMGNVRGLDRRLSDGRAWRGQPICGRPKEQGHMEVTLWKSGVNHWRLVHRLVLEAFTGPCPRGMEGAHNNGQPSDNRLSNLRWDTRKGNHADKIIHGTHQKGERNPAAKLTEAQVLAIRAANGTQCAIAAEYRVSQTTVCYIKSGEKWGWL